MNTDCPQVATPVGRPCGRCERPIADGDIGFEMPFLDADFNDSSIVYHHVCFMRSVGVSLIVPAVTASPMEEFTRIREVNCPKCHVTLDALAGVTSAAPWVSGFCPACNCPVRAHRL